MPAEDFQWNDDRTRFTLWDYTLIIIDPEVSPVALINIMRSCMPRQLFFSTHDHAIRYSDAWARKWEQDIRLHVRRIQCAAAAGATTRAPLAASASSWTTVKEYRRRQGGDRNWAVKKAAALEQTQE